MAEFNQDRFVLELVAQETTSSHRARATVNLWIYDPSQLIKLVVNKPPMTVNKNKTAIIAELKNVTENIVVIDDIRYSMIDAVYRLLLV